MPRRAPWRRILRSWTSAELWTRQSLRRAPVASGCSPVDCASTPGELSGATRFKRLVPLDARARAPLDGRGPFPSVKGAHERIDLLEAEHKRDFAHREVRVREQSSC